MAIVSTVEERRKEREVPSDSSLKAVTLHKPLCSD